MRRQLNALSRTVPDYAAARPEDCAILDEIGRMIEAGITCQVHEAVESARKLMGCYRAKDFLDPEVFTTALVGNLVRYPAPVVRLACCPICGLPRNQKFAPSIAEVAEYLDTTADRLKTHAVAARKALAFKSAA